MDKTRLAECNATLGDSSPQRYCKLWLTVDEVSEILRVDPRTIRGMIRRGELPAGRLGRVFRVPAEAFEELSRRGEGTW